MREKDESKKVTDWPFFFFLSQLGELALSAPLKTSCICNNRNNICCASVIAPPLVMVQ